MKANILVPLSEIVARLGQTSSGVRYFCKHLGVEIRSDWSGQEAVTEEDAARVAEEITRVGREAAEVQSRYQAELTAWERRKYAAGEAAFQDYLERAQKHVSEKMVSRVDSGDYAYYGGSEIGALSPGHYTAASEAAHEARKHFEKKNPVPTMERIEKLLRKGRK